MNVLKKEISSSLDKLPIERQRQVLDFVRALVLSIPEGTPIENLRKHVGKISKKDLKLMEQAIEDGCEQVFPGEW